MKRAVWIGVVALLAFGLILLTRFPAHWAFAALGDSVACGRSAGTVWQGSCAGLAIRDTMLGEVTWDVQPAALLEGKLGARLVLERTGAAARADIELGLGERLTARNVQASLPLDPAFLPQLPPNLRGSLRAELERLELQGRTVTAVLGRIQAIDVEQLGAGPVPLGSYLIAFLDPADEGGEPVGRLTDTDGPLAVQATLRLTREPGFVLEGLVAPRPGAPAELVRQLQFLGSADAAGRRPFSIAGTY